MRCLWIFALVSVAGSCTADPPPRCPTNAELTISVPPVPVFALADTVLYGSTTKTHGLTVDQLFVAEVAATSTSGNYDTFSVTLPKARLLQLPASDGMRALSASAETSCPEIVPTYALPSLEVVLGPPQLLPASGTLSLTTPFPVIARFDASRFYQRCWAIGGPGARVTGNGVDLLGAGSESVVPDTDGRVLIEIMLDGNQAAAPVQIVCTDVLGQSTVATYQLAKPAGG